MAQSKSKKSKKSDASGMERLINIMLENQERLSKAMASARKRSGNISEMMSEELAQSQRDALELTKMLATNPSDVSENTKAMMDAATKAQNRTLDFAKELYSQQVDAAESFRKSMQTVMENSRDAAEAAMEAGRCMSADNPFAEAWQKGMESLRAN